MNLFLTSLLTLLSSTLCVQLLEVSTNLFHQVIIFTKLLKTSTYDKIITLTENFQLSLDPLSPTHTAPAAIFRPQYLALKK